MFAILVYNYKFLYYGKVAMDTDFRMDHISFEFPCIYNIGNSTSFPGALK